MIWRGSGPELPKQREDVVTSEGVVDDIKGEHY